MISEEDDDGWNAMKYLVYDYQEAQMKIEVDTGPKTRHLSQEREKWIYRKSLSSSAGLCCTFLCGPRRQRPLIFMRDQNGL